jgi:predicted phosphodiesterase
VGRNSTVQGETVCEYLKEHPKLPTKTIARLLREDHPELFSSVDKARDSVRYHRGNHGAANRKRLVTKTHIRPNGKAGHFVIPAGLRQGRPPVIIKGPLKALILGDIHVPYHDETAVEAALKKGVDEGCNAIYLNGDSIDFYKLSRWIKDPRQRSPRKEVDMLKELLAEFGKYFPKRWYKMGNHEERWDTYLFQRAEDLIDFEEFELKEVLKLKQHGFECVYGKQRALMGKLNVIHGHEFPRGISSPVNPARGVWLRIKQTAVVGHFHRSSQHSESHPIKKETTCTWSTGCICDLEPEYASLNEWNHGFAIVTIGDGGDYQLENFLVERGKAYAI